MKFLQFNIEQWQTMHDHVAGSFPEEACGLVAGKGLVVNDIYPITNITHSESRFVMDPKEQYAAFKKIDNTNLELLGIYHSHPVGPDFPSLIDVRSFSYPGVFYLIWSKIKEDWQIRGFEIGTNVPEEVLLRFV